MRRLIYFMNLLLLFSCVIKADQYPHIIVNDRDKKAVLQKIENEPWAKAIFDQTKERLSFYVEKHQSEPDWILDRYLMNRIPGKRYTEFISDESVAVEGSYKETWEYIEKDLNSLNRHSNMNLIFEKE